jgi:hypothetical protein
MPRKGMLYRSLPLTRLPLLVTPSDVCFGDCDSDSECAPGLSCFIRGTGVLTTIYGCSGYGIAGLDYCYNATEAVLFNASTHLSTDASIDVDRDNNTTGFANFSKPSPSPVGAGPTASPAEKVDFSSSDDPTLEDVKCSEESPCSACQVSAAKCVFRMFCCFPPHIFLLWYLQG